MKEREWISRAAVNARVRLTDGEIERLSLEMKQLLSAAEEMDAPVFEECLYRSAVDEQALRPDEAKESLQAEILLSEAGEAMNGCFSVPRTLEDCHEE